MTNPPRRRRNGEPVAQNPRAITRARGKMTKRALAEAAGISEQLMGDIERGTRSARPETLAKIAEVLGRPVEELERRQRVTR